MKTVIFEPLWYKLRTLFNPWGIIKELKETISHKNDIIERQWMKNQELEATIADLRRELQKLLYKY